MSVKEAISELTHRPANRHTADRERGDSSSTTDELPGRLASNPAPAAVIGLQRAMGNKFVQRQLQRQSSGAENDCPGGCL
jgi:hypothetical protein